MGRICSVVPVFISVKDSLYDHGCTGAGAPSPPAFMRGVPPVRKLVAGGVRHPHLFHKKERGIRTGNTEREYFLRFASGNSYSPRPSASAGTPPSQVRGARRLSTRVPKLPVKFQFLCPKKERGCGREIFRTRIAVRKLPPTAADGFTRV